MHPTLELSMVKETACKFPDFGNIIQKAEAKMIYWYENNKNNNWLKQTEPLYFQRLLEEKLEAVWTAHSPTQSDDAIIEAFCILSMFYMVTAHSYPYEKISTRNNEA